MIGKIASSDTPSERRSSVGPMGIFLSSAFLADLVFPMFSIFLPLLAVELRADAFQLGLVGGVPYITYSFTPFVVGHYSDKIRSARPFLIAAFSTLAVFSFLYTVISNPWTLIFARIFEGAGWAIIWPVIQSGISKLSVDKASKNLGVYNIVWSSASVMGTMLGALFLIVLSVRFVFVLSTISLVLALALNLIFSTEASVAANKLGKAIRGESEVSSSPKPSITDYDDDTTSGKHDETIVENRRTLTKIFLFTVSIGAMTVTIVITFFPLYSGSVGVDVSLVGLISLGYIVARFLTYYIFSKGEIRQKILDRRNRGRNILIALGIMIISSALFIIPDKGGALYFVLFACIGAGYSLELTIVQSFIIAGAPAGQTGMGAGMFESSLGAGALLGPIVSGLVARSIVSLVFFLPIFLYSAAVVLVLLSFRERRSG